MLVSAFIAPSPSNGMAVAHQAKGGWCQNKKRGKAANIARDKMFKSTVLFGSGEPKGWMPWGVLVPIIAIVFTVVPLVSGTMLTRALGLLPERGAPVLPLELTASLIVPFAIMALMLFLWVRLIEKRPLASIGLGGDKAGACFARAFLAGLAMILLIVGAIWLSGGYSVGAVAPAFATPAALGSMLLLALGFAVQASVEEMVMRGWLLSAMSRRFGVVVASATSALLFALLHFDPDNPNLLVDAVTSILFSLFACYWAIKAGNIWGIMGWHAGWNWLQAVGFTIPVTGQQATVPALIAEMNPVGPDWMTGGSVGPEASVACLVVLIAALALFWAKTRKL